MNFFDTLYPPLSNTSLLLCCCFFSGQSRNFVFTLSYEHCAFIETMSRVHVLNAANSGLNAALFS